MRVARLEDEWGHPIEVDLGKVLWWEPCNAHTVSLTGEVMAEVAATRLHFGPYPNYKEVRAHHETIASLIERL